MKKVTLFICTVFLATLYFGQVDHSKWDEILKANVASNGNVNYAAIQKDSLKLNTYLKILSENEPKSTWSNQDKLAYWINVYNAFTVKLIISNYPVKSIKDIAGKLYKINTPWDIQFIKIGSNTYDLNNIEHNILRKQFEEPRIHFAINCASFSCPVLRNEAYTGNKLERQLDDQTRKFINDPSKNKITAEAASLSKLFSWFQGDFTKKMSLIEFINQYSSVKITSKTKISYLDYSWKLNSQ